MKDNEVVVVNGGTESSQILTKEDLHLCFDDERKSFGFGTT